MPNRAPGNALPPPVSAASLVDLFQREEQLREWIGKALHDDIGQSVSAIKMTAHLAMDEADPAQVREDLQALVAMADEVIMQLRELHARLYPPQLSVLGLAAALRAELTRQGSATDAEIALDAGPLPQRGAAPVEQAAFRIVQLLVADALARSGTRQLDISLRLRDAVALPLRLEMQVRTDTGTMFAVPSACQLRAQSVGGNVSGEACDDGYRISVQLPYPCACTAT